MPIYSEAHGANPVYPCTITVFPVALWFSYWMWLEDTITQIYQRSGVMGL